MNDLISRQAVIDALCRVCSDNCLPCELFPCEAVDAINNVSSAQPEIVRCRDCKHRIVNEHYGERGYPKIKAECEWDTGDPYGLGRNAEDDEWFCADGEMKGGE